jgi:hypothetical protein
VEVALIEYVEDVAPLIDEPSLFHWYVNGEVPLAATEKVVELPAVTDAALGWVVIDGAVTVVTKVSVAALLVTEPALLLATTE